MVHLAEPAARPRADHPDPTGPPPVRLAGVGFGFRPDPNGWLFRDVDLSVSPGEVVAVRGDNGTGKSSLIRLGSGLYPPLAGRVEVFGRAVREQDHLPDVGFVGSLPQGDGDLPMPPDLPVALFRRTVARDLGCAGVDAGWATEVAGRLALDAGEALGKRFGQLSKGWQLRHQWWAALARRPRLLLLDEPFDGLDVTIKPAVFALRREARLAFGPAVLLVSHSASELVRAGADRVFDLRDGQLVPRPQGRVQVTVRVDGREVYQSAAAVTNAELAEVFLDGLFESWAERVEVTATKPEGQP
jgi:manganese/iron transport system ATP-binding protein